VLRLFVETSNLDFQVALHDGSRFLYRSDEGGGSTSRELMDMVLAGLQAMGGKAADIDEIMVDTGPGGLTSTRSGISFANGLSFALDVPIVEVNSIELMVLEASLAKQHHVVGARRSNDGKFFMGFFMEGICLNLALGKPADLIHEMGWQSESLTWVGPIPKSWDSEAPIYNVQHVNLLSPSLSAFETMQTIDDFAHRGRVAAARPINEILR
jgi:tRNA threonylcarbamoyl adenosine modification protein YeaZ